MLLAELTGLHFSVCYAIVKVYAPLPLGCRGPPGFDGAAAVVCDGAVCDVGMIESMPCVTVA